MQIPIISGVYASVNGEFRTALPRNLVPVPKQNGISQGYLRPADGIVSFGTGPGVGRGGINWRGVCYRAMGSDLVRVDADGTVTTLGNILGGALVRFDYSFDRLIIAAGGNLFYWDGALTQVTDADLGLVVDAMWIGGYTMTTDGTNVVVTELNDPFSVNPLKYGSSEVDPDPVLAVLKLNNEAVVLNRHTIEFFRNVGGDFFPFQRIEGADISRGPIGTRAACVFEDAIAFLGSGRNESPAVWLGARGQAVKVSVREVDELLQDHDEATLSEVLLEARVDKSHRHLLVHLPDRTLVYDAAASAVMEQPIWFSLDSGVADPATYRARNLTWVYDRWLSDDTDSASVGAYDASTAQHYGAVTGWGFQTQVLYNEGRGAQVHELELVALPGRQVALGMDPTIWTSYSLDGELWSVEKPRSAGKQGERDKRLTWLNQGMLRNYRIQRFRGTSESHFSVARLEARVEALA